MKKGRKTLENYSNTTPQEVARFWSKVDQRGPDECWAWQGWIDQKGYGYFGYRYRMRRAHRISWLLTHGEWPGDLMVLHRCDNPSCVNPAHLFLGTAQDNTDDMIIKGRKRVGYRPKGSEHGNSKLTEIDIPVIRKMLNDGYTMDAVAAHFNVARSTIGRVKSGACWKHIP